MARPTREYFLLAEGFYAGHGVCYDYTECVELAQDMTKYLKEISCPDDTLYDIIMEYFETEPLELEMWFEQCRCGKLLGGQVFFCENDYDEHPDREPGYDSEYQTKWFCQQCRDKLKCKNCKTIITEETTGPYAINVVKCPKCDKDCCTHCLLDVCVNCAFK
jgi:hypothetical protein